MPARARQAGGQLHQRDALLAAPCRRSARPSAAGAAGWRAPSRARRASGRRRPARRRARSAWSSHADLVEQRIGLVARRPCRSGAAASAAGRRANSSAICTFSRTVSEAKVAVIWKVRPTPRRQIGARAAGRRCRGLRGARCRASGASWPLSMLKQVRLAGAVGADQRQQLAGVDARSETSSHAPARRRRPCAGPRPAGRALMRAPRASAATSALRPPTRPCGKSSTISEDHARRARRASSRSRAPPRPAAR